MCTYCGSSSSAEFFRKLETVLARGEVAIGHYRTLEKFQEMIDVHSHAYLTGTQLHILRDQSFCTGLSDDDFQWFIRHMVNNANDVSAARGMILKSNNEQRRARNSLLPWSHGKRVRL